MSLISSCLTHYICIILGRAIAAGPSLNLQAAQPHFSSLGFSKNRNLEFPPFDGADAAHFIR